MTKIVTVHGRGHRRGPLHPLRRSSIGRPLSEGFIFAVGMVVAFVPEGLLPTVTLALAMGVQRMAKRNALIKKLSSVETLGSCTVICTDKTGTLTQNEMTVREAWVAGRRLTVTGVGYEPTGEFQPAGLGRDVLRQPISASCVLAAALCNNAKLVPPHDEARTGRSSAIRPRPRCS